LRDGLEAEDAAAAEFADGEPHPGAVAGRGQEPEQPGQTKKLGFASPKEEAAHGTLGS
jgi:hypothetical protein